MWVIVMVFALLLSGCYPTLPPCYTSTNPEMERTFFGYHYCRGYSRRMLRKKARDAFRGLPDIPYRENEDVIDST